MAGTFRAPVADGSHDQASGEDEEAGQMLRRTNRMAPVVALAAAVVFAVTGCGNNDAQDSGNPPPGTTTQPVPTSSSPAGTGSRTAQANTVTAALTDFEVALSTTAFSPGAYTFNAQQKGQRPHALSIKGPGVDAATSTIQPGGGDQQLTVTLQPGSYELWCPVGDHEALGMTTTITVG